MRLYHVRGNSPLGHLDIKIPRSEIVAAKKNLKMGGNSAYDEMLRISSHPAAYLRLRMIPGTWRIQWILKICVYGVRLGFLGFLALLIMKYWLLAVGILVLAVIVNTYLQTLINYELGARLFVLDQYLQQKNSQDGSSKNDQSSKFAKSDSEKKTPKTAVIKDKKNDDPVIETRKRDFKNLLTKDLTRTERHIIVLYYYEEMTMKEIGLALDLSEARVSQMHSSIIARLKAQMNTRKKDFNKSKPPRRSVSFARFTDHAKKVMALAQKEAHRLDHEYIGTEHILLALTGTENNRGVKVLKSLGVNLKKLHQRIEIAVERGPDPSAYSHRLPQTPRAKKVIKYAIEEARTLNHTHVGTEHMLLGFLRETEGVACQVLTNLGLELQQVRSKVSTLFGDSSSPP